MAKTVTLEQFLTFGPCWLEEEGGRERLERIASRKKEWTALDVLRLPDDEVSPADKLWAVLREEFIDARTLHEIACICAERALTVAGVTDERFWDAIKAKRAWLRGEINDHVFNVICSIAWDCIEHTKRSKDLVSPIKLSAAYAAAYAAEAIVTSSVCYQSLDNAANAAAIDAEWAAVKYALWTSTRSAGWASARALKWDAEYKWQCEKLIDLLESEGKEE